MAQPSQPSDVTPERALERLIADAGQLHETKAALKTWLANHGIVLAEGFQKYYVAVRGNGHVLEKASFSTFNQALTFALNEAARRIASSDSVQPVDSHAKQGEVADA